jgi:zinc transporter ZupT
MAVAVLLTGLALLGVAGGVLLHRGISNHLAALGGLLLFAIAFIWIVPEITQSWGWARAILFVTGAALLLALVDWTLIRLGHSPRRGVLAPLIVATAIHSFLDGWSIRALATQPVPLALVPIGLGLHKIPEGFALGWVLRRSIASHARAIGLGALAELFTLVGALLQPDTDRFGITRFGDSWTPAVLCLIAGAFVFLGCHAVLPYFAKHEH